MPASPESASGKEKTAERAGDPTLFSGVNWLGDSVMTMPAIHEFRLRHPADLTIMLSKPSFVPLWRMNPDIDLVVDLNPSPVGTVQAAAAIRRMRCKRAYVLTQSFRSALVPFLAGIPSRTGMPGHFRDWMLTKVINPPMSESRRHQVFEYFDLLGISDPPEPKITSLAIPDSVSAPCRQRMASLLPDSGGRPLVGIFPGAAHGPSKCWPSDHFKEVAQRLVKRHGCRAAVFGSGKEAVACASIAAGMEDSAVDLSGKTSIPELAAMLSLCDVVIANDSGGMHLAAGVGRPVVAVFGITDPAKTGPLGRGHRILAAELVNRSRDLSPDSQDARDALLSILPEAVLDAALDILGDRARRHL